MQHIWKNPSGKKIIQIQENEKVKIFLEDFSKNPTKFKLKIELLGKNAECKVIGRMQSFGQNKKSWHIIQQFLGSNQKGSINLHGVAEDQSFLEFNGAGILENQANNIEIDITEKIVLFDEAKGKTLPILTVKTDQVKNAKHSASITPIDKNLIFYCESKGLSKTESENLLKQGFLKV